MECLPDGFFLFIQVTVYGPLFAAYELLFIAFRAFASIDFFLKPYLCAIHFRNSLIKQFFGVPKKLFGVFTSIRY